VVLEKRRGRWRRDGRRERAAALRKRKRVKVRVFNRVNG